MTGRSASDGGVAGVAGATAQHALVVPADVGPEEVRALAACSFVAARSGLSPDPEDHDQDHDHDQDGADQVRLSRHSTLHGPWPVATAPVDVAEALAAAGARCESVMADGAWVHAVRTLRERSEPVPFETGDRDGLRRTFPAGVPDREEGRVVTWLVAAARRLTGALVLDVAPRGEPVRRAALVPDPAADTDLTVLSDVWLTPEAALALCREAAPAAELGATGFAWDGPVTLEARSTLDRAALDDADLEVLASRPALEGYAVMLPVDDGRTRGRHAVGPLEAGPGAGGVVAVEVSGVPAPPPALRELSWLAEGGVQYAVRWFPDDDVEANREDPAPTVRAARARAARRAATVAAAVHHAVGGEVLDQSGFPVAPQDLC